jgi:predicted dehydrogenase
MSVKVAVIGAGYLGQHHARVYAELPDAELVGVVDTDRDRAGAIATKFGTKAFRSHKDVLDAAEAFSIVVPTVSHYEIALDCLRAGKDVLVEKPITATLEEADELIREADRNGSVLQVGHLERYNQGVISLSGMVVAPRFIEAVRVSPFLNRAADVDVTLDLMIHDIDIILGLVHSPIRTIRAAGFSLVTEKIDDARAWLEFENGAAALLTASRIARQKQRSLKVFQHKACLELDYQTAEVRLYEGASRPGHEASPAVSTDESFPGVTVQTVRPEQKEPLRSELQDFLRCVITRERPKVSGAEGRNALKTVLDINSCMRRTADDTHG